KDSKEEPVPTLLLVAPAANATVDLDATGNVAFSWKVEGGTIDGGYTLSLSASSDLSGAETFTETSTSREFTSANLDGTLGVLGWASGESKTLYWSVKPSSGSQKATLPETRSLSIKRITIPPPTIALQQPAEGATVDASVYAFPLAFQWTQAPEITAYSVKISTASAFPADASTVKYDVANANSKTLSAEEFDVLLEGFGVAYEGNLTLYWTVTPADENIEHATSTRTISATRKPGSTIVLNAPADEFAIDAEADFLAREILPLTFSWTTINEVTDYTLIFSVGQQTVTFDLSNADRKIFTEEKFDDLLEDLGVAYGATADIVWTVTPTTANDQINTQTRTIQATRWSNTVLVGDFAGDRVALTLANSSFGWVQPAAALPPVFNKYTSGSLGGLKSAHLANPTFMAFDKDGNMFVILREAYPLAGVVKINEIENTVEVIDIRTVASQSDPYRFWSLFTPNEIVYDEERDRFIIAVETRNTFEHFFTLDRKNDGGWELTPQKMTLAVNTANWTTLTDIAAVVDPTNTGLNANGGKHTMVLHPQTGDIYGHVNAYFYRADPVTFAAEVFPLASNNAAYGGTKHLAFDPQNPNHLWFSSYHHVNNHGLNYMDVSNQAYTHATPSNVSNVNEEGALSTAKFNTPRKLLFDRAGDNLYVSTNGGQSIRKVDMTVAGGMVSTLAGANGSTGTANGTGAAARFNGPMGLCLSPGEKILYVGDVNNHVIRKIRLVQP
ncbi:MAG: SusE domain-containing protein, partial [Bacteroidales bacterium]|nr:SusE domain-containing protein [Bacteroidales bacterium]